MTKPKAGVQRAAPKTAKKRAKRAKAVAKTKQVKTAGEAAQAVMADVAADLTEALEERTTEARTLNIKNALFVAEYLLDLNATRAAIRAGYSAKTAGAIGHELLKKPEIADAIEEAMAARAQRLNISQDDVIRELSRMAFFDPARIAGQPMSGPEDIALLPEDIRRSIIGWGWDKAGNFTLKLAPKTPALQLIGQHLGIFKQEIDLNLKGAVAGALEKARRRVNADATAGAARGA